MAPHLSKRTGKDCAGGRPDPANVGSIPDIGAVTGQDRKLNPNPVPSEDFTEGSTSLRTVPGGLPGLGRRR